MSNMITKADLEQFLREVEARVNQTTWSESEEHEASMNIVKHNARLHNLSVDDYLAENGVGKYKLLNLANEGIITENINEENGDFQLKKYRIVKTDGIDVNYDIHTKELSRK